MLSPVPGRCPTSRPTCRAATCSPCVGNGAAKPREQTPERGQPPGSSRHPRPRRAEQMERLQIPVSQGRGTNLLEDKWVGEGEAQLFAFPSLLRPKPVESRILPFFCGRMGVRSIKQGCLGSSTGGPYLGTPSAEPTCNKMSWGRWGLRLGFRSPLGTTAIEAVQHRWEASRPSLACPPPKSAPPRRGNRFTDGETESRSCLQLQEWRAHGDRAREGEERVAPPAWRFGSFLPRKGSGAGAWPPQS